jgi:uncharacterized protein YjbI with pentapeptide repeats
MASSFVPNKDNKSSGTNSFESNEIRIITDEPLTAAPDLNRYSKSLSNIMVNSLPRLTVGIYGGWGTGKTSLMKMIQNYLDENYKDDILTIWFDAWRYEYEKYLAIIPLVRTIKVRIDNKIFHDLQDKKPISAGLKKLKEGFTKTLDGLSKSVNLNASLSGVGASLDVDKLTDILGSEGSITLDGEKVYYRRQHITDYLAGYIKEFRDGVGARRIIIFIDDLDRCLPEKALELLESIKTFFDMEGIVFVIGIDPSTIDPITQTKYGKDSKIDGMKYLQKIVQLPYTMPLWNAGRLSDTITNMIKNTHLPNNVIEKVRDTKMQELIIKATELNPRDVKRFINSIVISHELYGHEIDDIEKIIVIQAFYFHGEKWIEFLRLLIPYQQRIAFLTHFILWLEKESTNISNLYDLKNILADNKNLEKDDYIYKSLTDKSLLDIYKKLIDIGDNELFTFLIVSKVTLLRIDKIERYLMVSDPVGMTNKVEKFLDIDSGKQLNLLRNGQVTEFNKYLAQGIPIHLPFEELSDFDLHDFDLRGSLFFMSQLSKANLSKAKLSEAYLYGADLSEAKLSEADLSKADLSEAYLYRADLSKADLSEAYLYGADLSEAKLSEATLYRADLPKAKLYRADLSKAYLYGAYLSEADLSEADLSKAYLSKAYLSKAYLSKAYLYGADLSEANLSKADLSEANLSKANLYGADLSEANLSRAMLLSTVIINCIYSKVIVDTHTDFSNAMIDNPDFLKHLREKGCKNIPNEIKNKQELRRELLKTDLNHETLEYYLGLSQLPES